MKHSSTKTAIDDKRCIPLDTVKIRRLRTALDITQEEAARRAGLASRQHWNNIESGRRANISIEQLDAIARALECRPADLLK